MLLEIIGEFIIEVLFIDILGGALSRLNNYVLKRRGIETRTVENIKFDKLKKRYEFKNVKLKVAHDQIPKNSKGIVLELVDNKTATVEFKILDQIAESVPLKKLILTRNNET